MTFSIKICRSFVCVECTFRFHQRLLFPVLQNVHLNKVFFLPLARLGTPVGIKCVGATFYWHRLCQSRTWLHPSQSYLVFGDSLCWIPTFIATLRLLPLSQMSAPALTFSGKNKQTKSHSIRFFLTRWKHAGISKMILGNSKGEQNRKKAITGSTQKQFDSDHTTWFPGFVHLVSRFVAGLTDLKYGCPVGWALSLFKALCLALLMHYPIYSH